MRRILNYLNYIFLGLLIAFISCKKTGNLSVTSKDDLVTLENEMTKLSFDLSKGTYDLTDKSSGKKVLGGAKLKINNWSSDEEGFHRTWKSRWFRTRWETDLHWNYPWKGKTPRP